MIESEEFQLLPVNQLIDIVSSDELNVRTEEQVYNAVMLWVRHNIPERRPHLQNVGIVSKLLFFYLEQTKFLAYLLGFKNAAR